MAFHFKSARERFPRRTLVVVLIILSFLCGAFEEVRTDASGWCAHFNTFMVCNTPGGTDYVLGE